MHRLEPAIAEDALDVLARRAAIAVLHSAWREVQPGAARSQEAAAADREAHAACEALDAAVDRVERAGGTPGSILAKVAAMYRPVGAEGYIAERLQLGATMGLVG